MERVSANFNCWREWFAGESDWNYGAMKMHNIDQQLMRGAMAIGNADHGLWWDIHCGEVTLEDAIMVGNRRSLIYEPSEGPFVARRVLAASGRREARVDGGANPIVAVANCQRARLEDSLFYTDSSPDVFSMIWYERSDEHAKRRELHPELFELRNCVVVGGPNVPFLVREANVGDRKSENYRSFLYRGQNNVFWKPNATEAPFAYANLNYTSVTQSFAQWMGRSETGARWLDPKLRDPANYDYRFAPDGPLYARRAEFPQYTLPAELRAKMEAFHAWIGWNEPQPKPV